MATASYPCPGLHFRAAPASAPLAAAFFRCMAALCLVCTVASAKAAAPSVPSVSVLEIFAFSELPRSTRVELVGTDTKQGDPANVLNSLMNGDPVLAKLEGTVVSLKFEPPVILRRLAVPRVGWDDWRVPDRVAVSTDGGHVGEFALTAPRLHPKAPVESVDVIDLGADVRVGRLDIEILGASVLKGANKHGTFRLLVPQAPRK